MAINQSFNISQDPFNAKKYNIFTKPPCIIYLTLQMRNLPEIKEKIENIEKKDLLKNKMYLCRNSLLNNIMLLLEQKNIELESFIIKKLLLR